MDFGKKILMNYGWSEGNSLGKNNTGITVPIKASFKFDNTGLGSNIQKTESGNHWWERVFNEASANIQVNSETDQVSLNTLDSNAVELTNKFYSMKKIQENHGAMTYGSFLKSSTLLANVGEEVPLPGHVTTDDIEIKEVDLMSDEALLEACEFRTAHKGARHGLKLSGKLARLAEQDKMLLEKLNNQGAKEGFFSDNKAKSDGDEGFVEVVHRKKKRHSKMEVEGIQENQNLANSETNLSKHGRHKSKKEKKRENKMENSLVDSLEEHVKLSEGDLFKLKDLGGIKKSKKKKKSKEVELKMFEELNNEELVDLLGNYRAEEPGTSGLSKSERKLSKREKKQKQKRREFLQKKPKFPKIDSEDSEASDLDVLEKLNLKKSVKQMKRPKRTRTEFEEKHLNEAPMNCETAEEKNKKKKKGYIRELAEQFEATKV